MKITFEITAKELQAALDGCVKVALEEGKKTDPLVFTIIKKPGINPANAVHLKPKRAVSGNGFKLVTKKLEFEMT